MGYRRTIVCLANSRKRLGRCVAGKEADRPGFGGWIRAVTIRETGEVYPDERRYAGRAEPELLDIASIEFTEPRPHGCQSENHLIDCRTQWVREGRLCWNDLDEALDREPDHLWLDGRKSWNGVNDRMPLAHADTLSDSLRLIEPVNLVLYVGEEGVGMGKPRRRVRAGFRFGREYYLLAVTDPVIEREYLGRRDGEYSISTARLCISISEPFEGNCYKLVAGIMQPESR